MNLSKTDFKVLLYVPGIPSGTRAVAQFKGGMFVVRGRKGLYLEAPAGQIDLITGGFNGRQWLVSWKAPAGTCSAMLQDGVAVDVFIREAPREVASQLRLARQALAPRGMAFRLGAALFVLALLLPLLALGLYWMNAERLSQWASGRISLEQEKQWGELAYAQMGPALKPLSRNDPVQEAVDIIGTRLTAGSHYRYIFHVVRDPRAHVLALPGGHVVVYTGLLQVAGTPEEFAGVLAHEVSHVELRHSLGAMIHSAGWRAVLAAGLGDWSGGVRAETIKAMTQAMTHDVVREFGSLRYGQDRERGADKAALVMLRRAGVSAAGMVQFMERSSHQESKTIALLSRHPVDQERIAALRQEMAQQGAHLSLPLEVNWPRIRRSLPDSAR